MSSKYNTVKLAIRNDKSKVICAMCKQCLITANRNVCVLNYVNDMNSRGKKEKANVSNTKNKKKQKPKVMKPKKVGSNERLASPKPSKPRSCLRSVFGELFNLEDNVYVAAILVSVDLSIRENILITRVYFVEGLGHNLFSVGQFCDSDLESWLWHQRLSHLNFDTINDLAKNNLVTGLPKFKYHKEHLCPSCEQGKSKRASHPPKPVPNSKQRLHLLHMDLCGPMRIASINGKRYVLVIVDDYSRYTWVHFLRSKDEAPEVIKTFLKRITVLLQSPVIIIRTDNGTEFKNQILKEYFDSVGISHQVSFVRTPQQNGVVERKNRMLVEAARTMLIFSRAPLFLWAEAIATAALCYPKNDRDDIRKLGAKGDIGFFIGYYADSCDYRVYNRRTKKLIETKNVTFDELLAMAFEQSSSKPVLQGMTSGQISSGLDLTYAPPTITTQQPTEGELDLLFEAMYDDHFGGQPSAALRTVTAAQAPQSDLDNSTNNVLIPLDSRTEDYHVYRLPFMRDPTLHKVMAEPIFDDIGKAPTEPNLSITSNDIEIELNEKFLVELRKNIYQGTYNEDVVEHIAKVLKLVDLIYVPGVDSHQLRMKVFPLSLADDAKEWWISEGRMEKITLGSSLLRNSSVDFILNHTMERMKYWMKERTGELIYSNSYQT
ncbi:retrovirus-related pol polyprotein from transposon TNT 1-94 [Tanacetum coccineum]